MGLYTLINTHGLLIIVISITIGASHNLDGPCFFFAKLPVVKHAKKVWLFFVK